MIGQKNNHTDYKRHNWISLSFSPSLPLSQTSTTYAELDHTGNPVVTRRPAPQHPQPVYSDVRDTRA